MSESNTKHLISRRDFDAVIFDLDGVITDTAKTHRKVWKEVFDEFLRRRYGEEFESFSTEDYRRFVDGKPRFDGIRSFLQSRDIELDEKNTVESGQNDTVHSIGMKKNRRYQTRVARGDIKVFHASIDLIHQLKNEGFKLGLVSSSRNAKLVLETLKIDNLFDERVDGITVADEGLAGKPAPEMFVEAARRLEVTPDRSVVVEDAESGVRAGRAGGFGLVVGISNAADERQALLEKGADIAVESLAQLGVQS